MISTILSSPVPPSSRSREPLVRASSNRSATVAFLWRCPSLLTKDHDASTELGGVHKVPVGIEDNLLLALPGHPVHLELPLVLQLGDRDRKALVVDLFCLTRPDVQYNGENLLMMSNVLTCYILGDLLRVPHSCSGGDGQAHHDSSET